jgi:hypothetical protein
VFSEELIAGRVVAPNRQDVCGNLLPLLPVYSSHLSRPFLLVHHKKGRIRLKFQGQNLSFGIVYQQASDWPFFEIILFHYGCCVNMYFSWNLLFQAPPAKYSVNAIMVTPCSTFLHVISSARFFVVQPDGCFASK